MFNCSFSSAFKKDYKRAIKRGLDMSLFEGVYSILEQKGELPPKYKAHPLTGNWGGCIDAHIQPDWVLIYRIDKSAGVIDFVRMGSHSDLF